MGVIIEIAIDPIGTCSTSVGDVIASIVKALQSMGLKVNVGPMGTSIELKNIDEVGEIIKVAHETAYRHGVKRIVSTVRIDDRRDKDETMEYKIKRASEAP